MWSLVYRNVEGSVLCNRPSGQYPCGQGWQRDSPPAVRLLPLRNGIQRVDFQQHHGQFGEAVSFRRQGDCRGDMIFSGWDSILDTFCHHFMTWFVTHVNLCHISARFLDLGRYTCVLHLKNSWCNLRNVSDFLLTL